MHIMYIFWMLSSVLYSTFTHFFRVVQVRREAARRAEFERKTAEEAERLRKTAQEAERLTKETAENLAKDNSARDSASAQTGNNLTSESSSSAPNVPKEVKSGGDTTCYNIKRIVCWCKFYSICVHLCLIKHLVC